MVGLEPTTAHLRIGPGRSYSLSFPDGRLWYSSYHTLFGAARRRTAPVCRALGVPLRAQLQALYGMG